MDYNVIGGYMEIACVIVLSICSVVLALKGGKTWFDDDSLAKDVQQ
jgi:hypothetical protein